MLDFFGASILSPERYRACFSSTMRILSMSLLVGLFLAFGPAYSYGADKSNYRELRDQKERNLADYLLANQKQKIVCKSSSPKGIDESKTLGDLVRGATKKSLFDKIRASSDGEILLRRIKSSSDGLGATLASFFFHALTSALTSGAVDFENPIALDSGEYSLILLAKDHPSGVTCVRLDQGRRKEAIRDMADESRSQQVEATQENAQ